MSLVDAGVGRTYIRRGGGGGNSNLAHSNIEYHGGREERVALCFS